jgi:hypothetical protein
MKYMKNLENSASENRKYSKPLKHLKSMAGALGTGMLAGMLLFSPAKKANADSFMNVQLCNPSNPSQCDFQVSGSYTDNGLGFLFENITVPPFSALNDGIEVTIYGLFYGDENNTAHPNYWAQTVTTNSDSSENFNFKVYHPYAPPINPWNPQNYSISWDSGAPAGIGSMALDAFLMVDVVNGYGQTLRGYVPAPSAVASSLSQFQPPQQPVAPEPVSSALMLAGAGTFGLRNYLNRKKKSKKDIYKAR